MPRISTWKQLLLMLLTVTFCSSAALAAKNVTVDLDNATLRHLFRTIEKQTDYRFSYRSDIVDDSKDITLHMTDKPVQDVLAAAFKGKPLTFSIVSDKSIIVKAKGQDDGAAAKAEPRLVSGVVSDDTGEPVIGANIRVSGTNTVATTDIDGRFAIKMNPESELTVTYIGYQPVTLRPGNKTDLAITLSENSEMLDEVVVIGYGTMKRRDLTGATGSVRGQDLEARNVIQLSNALQGATAGVTVTRGTGEPGSGDASSILIRGVTTIGDTNPLILVDGVPVSSVNDVNAQDIQDISVLKDAASASIYGSQAAAGVILITTKRSKEKDLKISYKFDYGFEFPTGIQEHVPFQRYMEMVNELKYNDNPSGGRFPIFTEDQVNNWVERNATDPDNYPITDWHDLCLRKSAPRQTHAISLSGGTEKVKTRASFSYESQDGLVKYVTDNYNRFQIRLNTDITINKFIAASIDATFAQAKREKPAFTNVYSGLNIASPAYAYRWTHGGLADCKGNNPYGRLIGEGDIHHRVQQVRGKAALYITPFKGLKISAIVAPKYNNYKYKTFNKTLGYTAQDDPNQIVGYFGNTVKLTEQRNDDNDMTTQILANYMNTFGKHDINAMVGYEDFYYFNESLTASRDQYEVDNFPYLDAGPSTYRDNSGTAYENSRRSYFGRIAYGYDGRYLIQANVRRDASSRFHRDHRWGTFPSVSAGWVISQEKFMRDAQSWVSFLKLRASYGQLGNERIGNYPYISLLDYTNSVMYNQLTDSEAAYYKGIAQIQYAIQDISWETTESYDIGIDLRMFNNRFSLTADYYRKNTKGMLLDLEIPKYLGYGNPSQNAGKMHTNGWDLELSWKDQIGEVTYGVSFNLSDYISKMGDLKGTQFLGDKVKYEGSYFNEWYGYVSDGLFLSEDELKTAPKLTGTEKVGDVKFRDISGPDGVPDGVISQEYDRVLLGNSMPRFLYGGNITAQYKGFDLNIAFQGVGSQNVRMTSQMVQPYLSDWGSVPAIIDGHYWSEFNTPEQNAVATFPRLTYTNKDSNNAMSTFWMFNGRYFRLKNLTIGYTLPEELTRKVYITNLRFYVSGNDLFCISNYPKGWDPERSNAGSYPITKSLLFGFQISF